MRNNHANSTITSFVVSFGRCPSCARLGMDTKGDNLANYSDNHSFCFSCGHLINPLLSRIPSAKVKPDILVSNPVQLPSDISIDYPQRALDWIGSYELTIDDLHNYNFLWSDHFQRLVYPVWQNGQCVFWTGRYFGVMQQSKWLNRGSPKDVIHCLKPHANRIIVVEDILSGIKITKAVEDCGALVLFNSHNPVNKLLKSGKSKQYFLWLDNDKFRESIFFAREAVGHMLDIKPVRTDLDPKECSLSYINEVLYKAVV